MLLPFLFFCSNNISGQQVSHTDSLELAYISGSYPKKDQLKILRELAETHKLTQKVLTYSNELIQAAATVDSVHYLFDGYLQKGNAFRMEGNLGNALEAYFKGANIASTSKESGTIYIAIADVYSAIGNHPNAVNYYQKAIGILKQEKDSINLASALYNLGDEYLKDDKSDSALAYTIQAQGLFRSISDQVGEAYCLGNSGKIYLKSGNDVLGEANLHKAITLLQESNEFPAICEYLISMSDIYHEKGKNDAAKNYALKSLEMAQENGLKQEISDASLKLSELYEYSGDHLSSLNYYKTFVRYRDSVRNLESIQQMADQRTDFEVSRKQKEVDLLATRNRLRIAERNGFIWASLLLAAILGASIYFYTQKAKRNKLVAAQKLQEAEISHQKDLLQSVITSQEAERKRIGMDLHDEVGAALSTLRIKIEKNADTDGAAYKSDIDKIIANMRNISHSLSPRISGSFGFYDAIYELADGVNRSGKISMTVNFDENQTPAFASEQAPMAVYRVIAELINNTLKHASAKNIQLSVVLADDKMNIIYTDDGIGISKKSGQSSNGMGMQNIESRLGIIGASWSLEQPEAGGYQMNISVPLK